MEQNKTSAKPPISKISKQPDKLEAAGLNIKPKKPAYFWWLVTGAVLLAVVIITITVSVIWYNNALQPFSGSTETVGVKIESGATMGDIAKELEQKKIVKSAFAMTLYTKLNNKDLIKTGTYYFAPNQSVAEIVNWINDGNVGMKKITILPGKTLKQIRQSLIDYSFAPSTVDAALSKNYNLPLFNDKPQAASLEGYIFPDTYFIDAAATPEDVLSAAFNEFQKRIDADDMRAKLAAKGFNLYQGITLASIVANETSNEQDQKQVAQVFEKRLAQDMALGSDVTYHYAADLLGVAPAVDLDSPYNTRIYKGLPPGPISNFNYPALQAVAQPAAGDYLYFVAGDDGVTYFSKTQEEHEQNIEDHCQKLCQGA